MTRRMLSALVALAAFGGLAAPAAGAPAVEGVSFAAGSSVSLGPPSGATHLRQAQVPLFLAGALTVSFRSDPGTGCASLGGCVYAGTIAYKPSGAQLVELSYRLHGRTHRDAMVVLGSFGASGADELYARVTRQVPGASPAVCADATPAGGFLSGRQTGAGFAFSLAPALSASRCAAPLASDLARALPVLTLTVPARRGTHVDLRHTAPFAAHGFAGTVTSTLRFTVGAPTSFPGSAGPPPGTHMQQTRYVQRALRVVAESGTLTFDVRGTPDAGVCILLDSCGLTGQMTLTPGLAGASGSIGTGGPASHPESYYARVLSGHGPRLLVSGGLNVGSAGTVLARVRQAGACTDTAPAGAGALLLSTSAGRLHAQYTAQASPSAGRTRCPGPELATATTLGAGSAPRAAMAARTLTIVLRAGPSFQDDGYVVTPHGQVRLTLRFGAVSQGVFSAPAP